MALVNFEKKLDVYETIVIEGIVIAKRYIATAKSKYESGSRNKEELL